MSQLASNALGFVSNYISPVKWNPFNPTKESAYWLHEAKYFNPGVTQKIWSVSSKHFLLNALLKVAQIALSFFSLPVDALVLIPTAIVGSIGYNTLAVFANLLLFMNNKVVQHINHRASANHKHFEYNPKGWYGLAALAIASAGYRYFK